MIDVIDLIPSKDLREALRESDREFTDMEKATIIVNLELTPSRTYGLLQQLRDETTDENLREQIQACLDSKDRALDAFRNGSEGCCDCLKFDAEGELAIMGALDPAEDNGPQFLPNITCKGKWPHYLYFEDRWIDLPNLYEQGDIVRVLGRVAGCIDEAYDWAVVDADRPGWDERSVRIRSWLRDVEAGAEEPKGGLGDCSDMQIALELPCKDGTFEHDHINPMFVERWEGGAECDEAELMQMAAWAVRGECSLWWTSRVLKKSILKGMAGEA